MLRDILFGISAAVVGLRRILLWAAIWYGSLDSSRPLNILEVCFNYSFETALTL